MDKFWEWMEKKDYAEEFCVTYPYGYQITFIEEPPKQMLIGYMIEYLMEYAIKNYSIQIKDFIDIDDLHNILILRIEDTNK